MSKQKLELTWIGKEKRPKLEPRILLEDPEVLSRQASRLRQRHLRQSADFGDNLLALKALEAEFAGKVKCVFIDPPYNTGSAFEHYDDGLEHSIWLGLMRDRLEIIKRLLSADGSLWIAIDDNEGHYLKVLCDEVLGVRRLSRRWCGRTFTGAAMQRLSRQHTTTSCCTRQWGRTGRRFETSSREAKKLRASTRTLTTTHVVRGDWVRSLQPARGTRGSCTR